VSEAAVPPARLTRLRASAEWRLLAVLSRASSRLAAAWWTLVGVRGALPAVFTLAMGALVGAVQAGAPLGAPLAAVGIVFVAMNALGPVHETVGTILGGRAGSWLLDRLMRACVEPPGLAHLERPDLAEELQRARDFDAGIMAPPLAVSLREIGNGFTEIASGLAQALLLAGYRWWAPFLVGGAWASTHLLLRESALWKIWQADGVVEQQRHVDYAYRLAVDAPAAKEVRLFGLSDWVVERFASRRRQFAEILYRERRLRQRPLGWALVLVVGANAIVFTSLARSAAAGTIELSHLVVFASAAVGCASLAFGEFDWWFRGSAVPIPKVLDLADAMRPAAAIASGPRSAAGLPAREIRFDGVRFAYPGTDAQVLDGFDLVVEAGRSLAIVGPNGAGKTTLAKLLCRLYDPQGGALSVDGVDLREIDLESWRARLAAVFQDYVRYELSLRENVAPQGASDAEIQRALELAGASDLAALDTVLSRQYQGGTDLSGGQWQRVALARALCAVGRGASVVLLDEPTAQLDVRGEAEIFDRILDATRGLTTILISHRFSTVRHADRICVLERGKVVEQGSHDELMALGGRYRRMFELQASRFYVEPAEDAVEGAGDDGATEEGGPRGA
jgi:ABC-type transport system involved in cytochrome bd biosynthesis fused ATPase/permease subunit